MRINPENNRTDLNQELVGKLMQAYDDFQLRFPVRADGQMIGKEAAAQIAVDFLQADRHHLERHDAVRRLVLLAAELTWATDGTLSSAVHHAEGIVAHLRQRIAELEAQLAEAQERSA